MTFLSLGLQPSFLACNFPEIESHVDHTFQGIHFGINKLRLSSMKIKELKGQTNEELNLDGRI